MLNPTRESPIIATKPQHNKKINKKANFFKKQGKGALSFLKTNKRIAKLTSISVCNYVDCVGKP